MQHLESIMPYLSEIQITKIKKLSQKLKILAEKYEINTSFTLQDEILKLLWYNYAEYDAYYYKRKINYKVLEKNFHEYKNLQVYKIIEYQDPIYNWQRISHNVCMPISWKIFLNIYKKFPSAELELFSIKQINEILTQQLDFIRGNIFSSYTGELITFLPVLTNNKLVIMHANVCNDSGYSEELYYVCKHQDNLILHISRLQEKIKKQEKSKYIPFNFMQNFTNFITALQKLF